MSRFGKLFRAAAAAALTTATAGPAAAQYPYQPQPYFPPPAQPFFPPPAPPDLSGYVYPDSVYPAGSFGKRAPAPCCDAAPPCCPPGTTLPGYPAAPGYPSQPAVPLPFPSGQQPSAPPGTAPGQAAPPSPTFAGVEGGAGGTGQTVASKGAYIENAVPVTMFRMRYDSAYGNNRPDRAEMFYAKCGCFGTRDAHGPPLLESKVDYQEATPYFEYAFSNRFSVFADIPVRFINPEQNANAAGISDVSFGMKYAFIADQQRVWSLWLRSIAPSGNPRLGLGTGNWWIEPGVLFLEQLQPRWQVFGELRDQAFLSRRSDFTGNILRYGLGTSYIVADWRWGYMAPVGEFVGWTALSGKEADETGAVISARGDTIVNAKGGVRFGFGQPQIGQFFATRSDLYIGYARALTGDVWYKDMLRVEFRYFF